ncbi:MAG: ParA family protein [Gammaproteobacteria bacterium]|nr:ParA family protein [Gammaproteobacteria bacterium]
MKRIVIINNKGGCGKTTIATNLAGYYAASGTATTLLDYDPQASSKRWLELRPDNLSSIHGIFACGPIPSGMTRSFAQRIPPDSKRLIVDTPASIKRLEISGLLRKATAVVVPVLPSAIDRHVTLDFIEQLTTLCRQSAINVPIGIVANRVRCNTRAYRQLIIDLDEIAIPLVGVFRDTQNYVQAAEEGRSIAELESRSVHLDRRQWWSLSHWLETGQPELQASATVLHGKQAELDLPDGAGVAGCLPQYS